MLLLCRSRSVNIVISSNILIFQSRLKVQLVSLSVQNLAMPTHSSSLPWITISWLSLWTQQRCLVFFLLMVHHQLHFYSFACNTTCNITSLTSVQTYIPLNFDLMLANSLLILFLSASRDLPMRSTCYLLYVAWYICVCTFVCILCMHIAWIVCVCMCACMHACDYNASL